MSPRPPPAERAVGERLAEFDTVLEVEVRQRRLDLESARAAIDAATDARAQRRRGAARRRRALQRRRGDQHRRPRRAGGAAPGRARPHAGAREHALAEARLDRALGRAGAVAEHVGDLQVARAGFSIAKAVTQGPQSCKPPTPVSYEPDVMDAIVVADLTRRFGQFVAVDHVSFDVRAGRDLRLPRRATARASRRPSGCCAACCKPTSGTATVGGIDVGRDPEGVKRRIGYMSQKFSLYELLTVDQNIRFFGGIYGLDRRRGSPSAAASCSRWPASTAARTTLAARPAGRLAPAAGARLRDPPRAADPVPRRADRRRRSAVAAAVLGADRRAVARRA